MEKIEWLGLTKKELQNILEKIGEPAFRATQVYEWLHKKQIGQIEQMHNLSKKLREQLGTMFQETELRLVQRQISSLDGTNKFLFALKDGNFIESVFMTYHYGNSVCISSQVGCKMGCRFCASTKDGFVRNLSSAELVKQIYEIQRIVQKPVQHVVVMGMGEPLENLENLEKMILILNDPSGMQMSQRNITVSTCGLVEQMKILADKQFQITLAVSLHAPDDTVRKQIMPIANRYQMEDVLKACEYYLQKTGRRVTIEYALIRGVNDLEQHATLLAKRLKPLHCHVNLIPVNPIREGLFQKTKSQQVIAFQNILEKYRINVTIRRELGADIDAACGQLRKRQIEDEVGVTK